MAPTLVRTRPHRRKSNVYCLLPYVDGRDTLPFEENAGITMLRECETDIYRPSILFTRYTTLIKEIDATIARVRYWAPQYIDAYNNKMDLPTLSFKELSQYGNVDAMTGIQLALWFLLETKLRGTTVWEIKDTTGISSNTVSGGMSDLHQAGIAAKLTLKR